jgi:Flp pilus assembly protein TadG
VPLPSSQLANLNTLAEDGAKAVSNLKPGSSGRRSTRKRGQAMVEFALVLPIFMLILAGILDFGFALYSRMTVISAAREGARVAVMQQSDVTTIPNLATQAAITAAAQGGLGLTAANVTVICVPAGSSCSFASTSSAHAGDSVKVTVNYTYKSFFPLMLGATFNLSSTVQMVID